MTAIYLDNAATSFPKAPGVGAAMAQYIDELGTNINRGTYDRATQAALTVLDTRTQIKSLFHFGGQETHVLFTPGATAGLNMILKGFLRPGDHAIVSSFEHNAVMRPLAELSHSGVTFSRIPADPSGATRARSLIPLIRDNTKLVLVSHASNVSGMLVPLQEVAAICRERGIPLAVDAAQTAGHIPIDFDALHLCALCAPGHKGLLGPSGIGVLLLEESFAKTLAPLIVGGTGSASDSEEQPSYMPDKFESGTPNLPGIFGLKAALDYMEQRTPLELRAHEILLTQQLLDGLAALPVRVIGTADARERAGVVSIDFLTLDNAEAAFLLETQHGILTRCGLHCAPNAHKALDTFPQGTVRFSIGHTTTQDNVAAAVDAVRAILAQAGQ